MAKVWSNHDIQAVVVKIRERLISMTLDKGIMLIMKG
jgi:hypothetical protein